MSRGLSHRDHPRDWFVGKHVKVGFRSRSGNVEHMWVAVNGVKGQRLVGELLSDPLWIRSIQPGDHVELKRYHVQAVAATDS